jgi:peptide/nickel transport system substrate-binding protein
MRGSVHIGSSGREARALRATQALLVGTAAISLVLAGCSSNSTGSNVVTDGTVTIIQKDGPDNLDPLIAVSGSVATVVNWAYDSLVNVNKQGTVVSGLADKWTETPKSVTYTLREGITCSDGPTLTASDVAANFQFVLDPKNASSALGVNVPPGMKVEADDATRTITMSTEGPTPFMLQRTGTMLIVCKKGTEDRTLLARATYGTGPYVLAEAVSGDHYTFNRRDTYAWGPDGATAADLPKTVTIRIISNESTAVNLLINGQANIAFVQGPDRQRLEPLNLFTHTAVTMAGMFIFNEAEGHLLADEKTRLGLIQAVDFEKVRKVLTEGTGVAPTGLINGSPCTGETTTSTPAFNLEAAKAALAGAGWQPGSNGKLQKDGKTLAVQLDYPAALPPAALAMELVRDQWNAVGVDTMLKGITAAEAGAEIASLAWDVGLTAIQADPPVPSTMQTIFSGPGLPNGLNFGHVNNPTYNRLAEEATRLTGTAACDKWDEADRALQSRGDVVAWANSTTPNFGKNVTFEKVRGTIVPTSLRLYS